MFLEFLQKTFNCRIGVYDLSGKHIIGDKLGFKYTDDLYINKDYTWIRDGEYIICMNIVLSNEACRFVRGTFDYFSNDELQNVMNPLQYCLTEGASQEDLRGKYIGYSVMFLKCNKDIMDILHGIYDEYGLYIFKDNEGIYIGGVIDDMEQQGNSIVNTLFQERGIDILIGGGEAVSELYTIKDSLNHAVEAAELAAKLGYKSGYYPIGKMAIEGLIYSLDDDKIKFYTKGLYKGFGEIFRDRELIHTAQELLNCDLNISMASRRLYVHRNTFLYRLEKIKFITGLDIKKFEDAVIFKTMLSIYKLKFK